MSLDFYLRRIQPTEIYWRNTTHNHIPMWKLAGVYEDLYDSEGKNAKEILKNLKRGLSHMRRYPTKYRQLNPENGWGSYQYALEFLEETIKACKEYPDAIIHISA